MPLPSKFSGTDGVSAARWLRSLIHDLPADLSLSQWFSRVDSLLVSDAARWAEQHPRVRRMLTDEYYLHDAADINTFTRAITARFPPVEKPTVKQARLQLMFLKQSQDETLDSYYRRAESLLYAVGGVDRHEGPLSHVEELGLSKVLEKYIHGLCDEGLKENVILYHQQRTLQIDKNAPGLQEIHKYSKCHLEKSILIKESLAVAHGAPEAPKAANQLSSAFPPSSPPELSFSGLFGSSGNSHDSFTRSAYGSQSINGNLLLIGNQGMAMVAEGVADHWAINRNFAKVLAPKIDSAAAEAKGQSVYNTAHPLQASQGSNRHSVADCDTDIAVRHASAGSSLVDGAGDFNGFLMSGGLGVSSPTSVSAGSSNSFSYSRIPARHASTTERPRSVLKHSTSTQDTAGPVSPDTSTPDIGESPSGPSIHGRPLASKSAKTAVGFGNSFRSPASAISQDPNNTGSPFQSNVSKFATVDPSNPSIVSIDGLLRRTPSHTPPPGMINGTSTADSNAYSGKTSKEASPKKSFNFLNPLGLNPNSKKSNDRSKLNQSSSSPRSSSAGHKRRSSLPTSSAIEANN